MASLPGLGLIVFGKLGSGGLANFWTESKRSGERLPSAVRRASAGSQLKKLRLECSSVIALRPWTANSL